MPQTNRILNLHTTPNIQSFSQIKTANYTDDKAAYNSQVYQKIAPVFIVYSRNVNTHLQPLLRNGRSNRFDSPNRRTITLKLNIFKFEKFSNKSLKCEERAFSNEICTNILSCLVGFIHRIHIERAFLIYSARLYHVCNITIDTICKTLCNKLRYSI